MTRPGASPVVDGFFGAAGLHELLGPYETEAVKTAMAECYIRGVRDGAEQLTGFAQRLSAVVGGLSIINPARQAGRS